MPLHIQYSGRVAGSEICRCRGNHVGRVKSEHEALRHLAVNERRDLRDNLLHELLFRPAVRLSLAPYRQYEVAFEQRRAFRERPRPAVPLHVDELVREVLVWAFLVSISPYRMALRRRGLHAHLAVKQSGECHVRIEVCDCAHSFLRCNTLVVATETMYRITSSQKPTPRPIGEPEVLILKA